jgi:hypothetical protein
MKNTLFKTVKSWLSSEVEDYEIVEFLEALIVIIAEVETKLKPHEERNFLIAKGFAKLYFNNRFEEDRRIKNSRFVESSRENGEPKNAFMISVMRDIIDDFNRK